MLDSRRSAPVGRAVPDLDEAVAREAAYEGPDAGGVANEVLSLLRAVAAFGGEEHEARRYTSYLAAARAAGIAQGRGIGLAVGVMVSTF